MGYCTLVELLDAYSVDQSYMVVVVVQSMATAVAVSLILVDYYTWRHLVHKPPFKPVMITKIKSQFKFMANFQKKPTEADR